MLETIGWFALIYVCISLTVTVLLLVFANKTFKLGGPLGMARSAVLLVLVGVAFVIWAIKSAVSSGPTRTFDDEVKHTVKKTSQYMDKLKKEWDDAKKD